MRGDAVDFVGDLVEEFAHAVDFIERVEHVFRRLFELLDVFDHIVVLVVTVVIGRQGDGLQLLESILLVLAFGAPHLTHLLAIIPDGQCQLV